ncbi:MULTISPECIES: PaaI family thioesterase [unclassified Roseitalea]|uniref:PaaI family thioesterase n=1 Tax=unclassified Roseitalea TaxID=2639107 RepID=UPI00273E2F59|nr:MULTISPECIES: PaaI family thioesterase [unclassified Roseitalea]
MEPSALSPVMDVEALEAFLARDFPQLHADGRHYRVVRVKPGTVTMRLSPEDRHLRPGGTVSGPTLFTLADVGAYLAILAHIGPSALTVTTNLTINFMHKAAPGPLEGMARLLKLGKRLAVVETTITDAEGRLIAHATGTYSIPPDRHDAVK